MGSTPPSRATRSDLDAQVRGYAQAVLAEWLATDIWQPAQRCERSRRRAAEEYAGRFLLELLQNAHDAHPAGGRDGKCSLVLDEDEDEHGVLYVANGGAGFRLGPRQGHLQARAEPEGRRRGHRQ